MNTCLSKKSIYFGIGQASKILDKSFSLFYIAYTTLFSKLPKFSYRGFIVFKKIIVFTFIVCLFSCSSSTRTARPPGSSSDVIGEVELSTIASPNVYEVIENLRPNSGYESDLSGQSGWQIELLLLFISTGHDMGMSILFGKL